MVEKYFRKDPDATLDYAFDWATDWLEDSEIISSHIITITTGLTKDSDSELNGVITIWVSGGTVDEEYYVACKITTDLGRIDERTIRIQCVER